MTTLYCENIVCSLCPSNMFRHLQGHHQGGVYKGKQTPNFQPTATQGMYNLRFTILINTNNTSNY